VVLISVSLALSQTSAYIASQAHSLDWSDLASMGVHLCWESVDCVPSRVGPEHNHRQGSEKAPKAKDFCTIKTNSHKNWHRYSTLAKHSSQTLVWQLPVLLLWPCETTDTRYITWCTCLHPSFHTCYTLEMVDMSVSHLSVVCLVPLL